MMLRPRSVAALVALACALAAGPAHAATSLYPDLKTLAPTALRFDSGPFTAEGEIHYVLRFTNTVWNAGQGPMEIHGTPGGGTTVTQRIFDDAGGFSDVAVSTDLLFHPSHNHFHLQDFAQYQLWTRADYDAWVASGRRNGQAKHVGSKSSFCIRDSRRVETLPGTPTGRGAYSDCGATVQGMSVGWGDTYGWALPEQWVDLGASPLSDGDYVLRSIADPLNKLYESNRRADDSRESAQANEATTAFSVVGGHIREMR